MFWVRCWFGAWCDAVAGGSGPWLSASVWKGSPRRRRFGGYSQVRTRALGSSGWRRCGGLIPAPGWTPDQSRRRCGSWRPPRGVVANFGKESSHSYRTLITTDAEIVRRIGIWTVLSSAASACWRRCVIEHFLDDEDFLHEIANVYPDELLWAIRSVERSDLADFALRIFQTYRTDPYLVNCAIQCLSRLDNKAALAEAVNAGRVLLTANSNTSTGGSTLWPCRSRQAVPPACHK